ncbi:YciI family protein [Streptomyces sp. NPDC060194]|uniref:YciI family protein n=1 Tax=Streptomyces sp. NPDC060194 TaxID=3347069 RepID=UPI0036618FA0
MKYLLLVCTEGPFEASEAELDPTAWVEENDRKGVRLLGDRVRPAEDATTVRVRDGRLLLTDGPFAETKEQMGGFDVVECADLDEAIEVAAAHPMAKFGMIEIRPFWTE